MVLRRPTRLIVTLGVVAMLLVAGGIAAASLLSRKNEAPAAPYDEPATAPSHDSWQRVTDTAAKLTFEVPPDWELADDDESLTTSNGVKLGHLADWGRYTCQGAEYGRAFAASGVAQPDRKPGRAAGELAAAVAADQYSDGHRTAAVKVEKPQPLAVDGAQGALVRAEATLPESGEPDECTGTKGTVTVVALTTSAGNSVLVVAADAVPGRDEPTPLADPARLDAIVKSLRVAP
ncbi:hypothetical protein ALI144C_48235 [Actinosynnema sp. ALI-1.44]|uniref:hypothetical protein n=1 Tax=Actinosynnema sp. ALI-1.44 TaxID=1933779 RepID=UPI00097BAA7F|nr:hypothetical protein [Actinosynnema sp. ALI-1.44]ONI70447.1 hypothetical protein ALI144C_48235 [Actinosynnema sp. ALI-1.44]